MARKHATHNLRREVPKNFFVPPPLPVEIHVTSENKGYVVDNMPHHYTEEYAVKIAERHFAPQLFKDCVSVTSYVAEEMGLQGLIFRGQFSMGKTQMFDALVNSKIKDFMELQEPCEGFIPCNS